MMSPDFTYNHALFFKSQKPDNISSSYQLTLKTKLKIIKNTEKIKQKLTKELYTDGS